MWYQVILTKSSNRVFLLTSIGIFVKKIGVWVFVVHLKHLKGLFHKVCIVFCLCRSSYYRTFICKITLSTCKERKKYIYIYIYIYIYNICVYVCMCKFIYFYMITKKFNFIYTCKMLNMFLLWWPDYAVFLCLRIPLREFSREIA